MARRATARAIALSVAIHLAMVALLIAMLPLWPWPGNIAIALIDLPPLPTVSFADDPDPLTTSTPPELRAPIEYRSAGDEDRSVPSPSAPTSAANPDPRAGVAAASAGKSGGAPTALTERADAVNLRVQPYDATFGYEVQRIRTADERATREEARDTPHPAGSPWLSSHEGPGHARHAPTPAPAQAARDERAPDPAHGRELLAATVARPESPAAARDPEGVARPWLPRDPAATDTAPIREEVSDRLDQPLVSDTRVPDKIELTRPASPGSKDSSTGEGKLGFTPDARGTAPVPTGAPDLPLANRLAIASYQRQYEQYVSRLKQKVDPLWSFPRDLALRLEQGDLVVTFTIERDGRLKDLRLVKRSGFPTFDKNVLRAIKKAAPFDPLPATFGRELRVTAPFAGGSPAIR